MNGDVGLVGVGGAELVGDDTLEVAHVAFLKVVQVEVGSEVEDLAAVTQKPGLLSAVHSLRQHLSSRTKLITQNLSVETFYYTKFSKDFLGLV